MLNAVGYTIIILIYRHSIRVVFNRKIPTIRKDDEGYIKPELHSAVQSFNTHLLMLRPLEILFRFITAPMRVLPDVIVIGETRCGTTNLCGHIVSLSSISSHSDEHMKIKCYTPFCAWAHPILDHKESFYFVGHYLGIVDPYFYRMAFPLKITRWWEEKVLGNFFFCFDGCAQYLSHPSVPYLIASSYQGNESPPVLVACIRNPVDQAISWWKYENNAISWGESIGLKEWDTGLRSPQYPPKTIADALELSRSDFVLKAYSNAEKLVKELIQRDDDRNTSSATKSLFKLFTGDIKRLPSWAITWPAGQLSSIGRSCNYARNIERYNHVFSTAFEGKQSGASNIGNSTERNCNNNVATSKQKIPNDTSMDHSEETRHTNTQNQIGFVHVVPIECQSSGRALNLAIRPMLDQCVQRCVHRRKLSYETVMLTMDCAINRLCESFEMTRRNPSAMLSNLEKEPSQEDIAMLHKCF
eukprot:CAMPEP_0201916438 /NCGR_PEP_ID=MMETSP0903-20130614/6067_1 /ASSEMBLY_ACC=CAM_ASM_000552 /TAXON_ID=420261 /ORGANISM="Thalassiosira antarctica, Strain CCMP982" /LENGTH=470 /DNA_ID=CAMNT_0048452243 /DNA_START=228 /DNA_END=1637 /DNA_ORIENTATION=-